MQQKIGLLPTNLLLCQKECSRSMYSPVRVYVWDQTSCHDFRLLFWEGVSCEDLFLGWTLLPGSPIGTTKVSCEKATRSTHNEIIHRERWFRPNIKRQFSCEIVSNRHVTAPRQLFESVIGWDYFCFTDFLVVFSFSLPWFSVVHRDLFIGVKTSKILYLNTMNREDGIYFTTTSSNSAHPIFLHFQPLLQILYITWKFIQVLRVL